MNPFTETVWDVITDNPILFEELNAIMRQEYKPFLNYEQAFAANTHLLKQQMFEKFAKWLAWLPTLPIDQLGSALAEEAFELVEWGHIATLVKEHIAAASK